MITHNNKNDNTNNDNDNNTNNDNSNNDNNNSNDNNSSNNNKQIMLGGPLAPLPARPGAPAGLGSGCRGGGPGQGAGPRACGDRKGTNGLNTDGVTAMFMRFYRRYFSLLPSNLCNIYIYIYTHVYIYI